MAFSSDAALFEEPQYMGVTYPQFFGKLVYAQHESETLGFGKK
jgi:hypothetical protein